MSNDSSTASDTASSDTASELSSSGYQETGIQDTAGEPETKEELRGAKEYAEMIVDTVREGLLVLDLDLRVMSANQSFYDLFEVDPEETVGRKVYDLGNGQWDIPELHELLEEILPENKVMGDYKVEHDFEGIGRRVMLLNARQINEHELILLAIEDVTERQQTQHELHENQERYRLLLESVEEYAIILMDAEGRITTWNAGARGIFGYEKEEALGQRAAMLYTPEDRKAGLFDKKLQQAHAEGRAAHEHQLARRDGSRFWGTGMITPIHTKEGELRFAKVMRDNTERREREEQIRQLNETLEERVEKRTRQVRRLASQLTMAEQRERRRIAHILHDEIQQLIYGAEMTARRLRRGLPEQGTVLTAELLEEKTAMLDQVEEALDEAVQATRELSKELSPPELQSDDLAGTLRWLAGHMKERFGLSVEVRLVGPLPPIENRDLHTLLFRLLRELLFNVVKHAEVDRALLEARAKGDSRLRLTVKDEGVGFDPASLEKGQRGLGLSDMRERLEVLGGRLNLTAAPGEGVEVKVVVPNTANGDA